jgi:hypothetical protein
LEALFADPSVIDDLTALGAGVSLGILDLGPERAAAVQRLNEAGVPVVAWLLLPKEEGYWFNVGNAPQAAARYADWTAWTTEHGLQWTGLGIDIEPDIREIEQLLSDPRRWVPSLLRRAFDSEGLRRAQAAYGALVTQMRADGYRVESYEFPFIVDERRAGATLLQRLAGLVDVPVDREVLMLYTSWFRSVSPGVLWSYAPDAGSVAVGSSGGGVEIEGLGELPPLGWEEFSRDLRLARHWHEKVYVFSLEGCVRQGFLARLKTFDWERPITPPLETARQVEAVRRALRAVLWASAHPLVVLVGLVAALWLLFRLRSARGHRR